MPDSNTLAVLRDVVCIAILAAFLGAAAYGYLRRSIPMLAWDHGGRVPVGQFGTADWLVALLLTLLLTSTLLFAPPQSGSTIKHEALSDVEQLGAVAQTLMMDLMLVGLVVGFMRVIRDFDPAELFGLRLMKVSRAFLKALGWILPAYLVIRGVTEVASHFLDGVWPDMGPQSAVKILQNTKNPLVKLAMALTAAIVAPLAEEILFRGFIYGVLKRYTDTYFAGLLSAVLFAAIHLHVGLFLPLFALGLIFVAAYEATGCLLVSIFMHALFNGSQELLMFAQDK